MNIRQCNWLLFLSFGVVISASAQSSSTGYPPPPRGVPDKVNGGQGFVDLNGDWEGYYAAPGVVTDIRVSHLKGHLTAELLRSDLTPSGKPFFRGDFGQTLGVAQVDVVNANLLSAMTGVQSDSWTHQTLSLIDFDHFQIDSRAPFQRITAPRRNDVPCSSQNEFKIGAPWAGMRGRVAHDAKDYLTASCWFYVAAVQGDVKAQLFLAYYLHDGLGRAQDRYQAFHWAYKSAEGGLYLGAASVADMYEQGDGVNADPAQARYWRSRAEELLRQSQRENSADTAQQKRDRSQIIEAAGLAAIFGALFVYDVSTDDVCQSGTEAENSAKHRWLAANDKVCQNGRVVSR